jgi:DHA1 family bicyclomycin/chloramphenicol resistance-like MFS transporter
LVWFSLACLGISNPNTAALTLEQNAGSASALMGAIQLGLGRLFLLGLL